MSKFPNGKETCALALGSGGEKGFVHIGVLKALEELNINITHVGGTSVGSLVGGMYALWKDVRKIEHIALEMDGKMLMKLLTTYWKGPFHFRKNDLLLYLIDSYLKDATFEECLIPFVAVSMDLNSGERIFHKSGPLKHAIRASSSVPYLFGPYNYNNQSLVDGGYVDSVPVEAVREIGGQNVLGVNLKSFTKAYPKKRSFVSTQAKVYNSMLYNIAKDDTDLADIKLSFDLESLSIKDIIENREKYIDMGYRRTIELFS